MAYEAIDELNDFVFTSNKLEKHIFSVEDIKNFVLPSTYNSSSSYTDEKTKLIFIRLTTTKLLCIDPAYVFNSLIIQDYQIIYDVSKRFSLAFKKKIDASPSVEIDTLLQTLKYDRTLPITDISQIFMKTIQFTQPYGVLFGPGNPYIHLVRSVDGAVISTNVSTEFALEYDTVKIRRGIGIFWDPSISRSSFKLKYPGVYMFRGRWSLLFNSGQDTLPFSNAFTSVYVNNVQCPYNEEPQVSNGIQIRTASNFNIICHITDTNLTEQYSEDNQAVVQVRGYYLLPSGVPAQPAHNIDLAEAAYHLQIVFLG